MNLTHPFVSAALACVAGIVGLTAAHDAVPVILPYLAIGFTAGAGVALPNPPTTPPAA